ncbi:hypothetical protein OK016_06305 [Vibrio chagasii]|nr:hypothetical protein [Vibrio chagasii]
MSAERSITIKPSINNSSSTKTSSLISEAAMKPAARKEDLARDMLQMLVDFIHRIRVAARRKAIEAQNYPVEQLIHLITKCMAAAHTVGYQGLNQSVHDRRAALRYFR